MAGGADDGKAGLKQLGIARPTLHDVDNKYKKVKAILDSKYTAKDIEEHIDKQNDEKMASKI